MPGPGEGSPGPVQAGGNTLCLPEQGYKQSDGVHAL